jgi:hypothetical protein
LVNESIWILSNAKTLISPDKAILAVADDTAVDAMIVGAPQAPAGSFQALNQSYLIHFKDIVYIHDGWPNFPSNFFR